MPSAAPLTISVPFPSNAPLPILTADEVDAVIPPEWHARLPDGFPKPAPGVDPAAFYQCYVMCLREIIRMQTTSDFTS